MNRQQIISIINNIGRQYKGYKDGGREFIYMLSNKLLNTIENDRNEVLTFFLEEIENNENGFMSVALATIKEMKAVELGPEIIKIYERNKSIKDNEWKKAIISVLMNIRYLPPQKLYYNYVLDCMKNNKDSFYLLVQYCNVNPKDALPLLSEEFVENILSEELLLRLPEKISNSLQGLSVLVAFLVTYLKNNPYDYLPDLLKLIYIKKPKAAIYLKTVIINYLSSEFARYSFSESWLNNEISYLNNLSYFSD